VSIEQLPLDYLLWLGSIEIRSPELCHAVRTEIERRAYQESLIREQGETDWLKAIFRKLALKYHPDRGGSDMAMAVVNEFFEMVRQAISEPDQA
jgi:hypothetical protein